MVDEDMARRVRCRAKQRAEDEGNTGGKRREGHQQISTRAPSFALTGIRNDTAYIGIMWGMHHVDKVDG